MATPQSYSIYCLFLFLFFSCGSDKETPTPIISVSSFSPESGIPGDEVVILGKNLSAVDGVLFGSVPASIVGTPTETQVKVTVPQNSATGFIVVRSSGQEVVTTTKFTIHQKPTITGFTPSSRSVNEIFTITGTNFSNTSSNNLVTINGHTLSVVSASPTSLEVKATPGTTTGKIEVSVNGLSATSGTQLEFLPHAISGVKSQLYNYTLTGAGSGYSLVILGGVFSKIKEEVVVTFNGVPATSFTPYETSVNATIPTGATSGKLAIKIGPFSKEIPFDIYPGIWTRKTDLTGPSRQIATAFAIGNKAYVGTGITGSPGAFTYFKDIWEYNSATDQWTQKANFPGAARQGAVSFSINGKGYLGTGFSSGGALKDFWEYDPATDQWTQKADFPGLARSRALGFSIGGFGYLGAGNSTDFFKYDPSTNQWTQVANYPESASNDAEAVVVGSKAYAGLGTSGSIKFWEYNPSNNQWTQKTDFPSKARSGTFGFAVNGKVIIGGGEDNGNDDVWEYDPATNSWKQVAHILGNFASWPISFEIDGKGYTGIDGSAGSRQLWVFQY